MDFSIGSSLLSTRKQQTENIYANCIFKDQNLQLHKLSDDCIRLTFISYLNKTTNVIQFWLIDLCK